jgi:hypothetical protein
MLVIILTLLILGSAAVIFIARRQTHSSLLEAQAPGKFDGENLRPLFAPDESDLRAFELEEQANAAKQSEEDARLQAEQNLAIFKEFRQTWRDSPSRANTVELLIRASELESGQIYLDTVDELLHKRSDAFKSADLAQLIESHFWLLPQTERTPGITFTINRALAALRARSHTKSEEEASDARN